MSLTALAFLIAFGVGSFLAFARHPIYGLLTYMATYYLAPPVRWWGASLPDLRWSLLPALITLVALLVQRDKKPTTIPLFGHGVMIGLVLFLAWIAVQSFWVLDWDSHLDLLTITVKYVVLAGLIYKCIQTEQHLRWFLWTHVLGCAYLGFLEYTSYLGGRFEAFGAADIEEANSGALVLVTGIFVGSSLFLITNWRGKLAILACMPFIVNSVVDTISRSGFLALGIGGVLFNLFTPKRFRGRVRVLSVLAIVMFLLVTNPIYWARMGSLKEAGEHVEGVDTGAGRVDLIKAQWQMFEAHPLGCGHRCTATLSPAYLPDYELTGEGANRARASHNTVMTMLVEHGVPGVLFYLAYVVWLFRNVRTLVRSFAGQEGLLPTLVPGIAAIAGAFVVGDQFVDYLILESRVWFIAVIMVMLNMAAERARTAAPAPAPQPAFAAGPLPRHAVAAPRGRSPAAGGERES